MPETFRTPGLVLTEHEFEVPLDHAQPHGERITVFAREVADPDGRDRPLLVFFQGGPGFEAPRPTRHPSGPGWLDRALEDFRVLMLDQRGTGRSTPLTISTLVGRSPQEQAEYVRHFRADSIVRDAEHIREALGVDRWSVLGQSFGGFCVTTYLSLAPDGLREAFITGGCRLWDATRMRSTRRRSRASSSATGATTTATRTTAHAYRRCSGGSTQTTCGCPTATGSRPAGSGRSATGWA